MKKKQKKHPPVLCKFWDIIVP